MLNLSIPASGGRILIQYPNKIPPSCNCAIPISIPFSRRKRVGFLGKKSKSSCFDVKSQYLTPEEQRQQQQQPRFPSYEPPPPSQPGQLQPKIYVGYSVYKGKAALTVEPRSPEFIPLDFMNILCCLEKSGAFKLSKEGIILLQFAPAVGVRQYDWSRKQIFSLSVTEIGTIMSLGARDSCEFFHDPFKGKSDEGRVRKVLKVEPLPDGSGHFFNLSVQNKLINVDENIYIPITKAEFAVLVSSFNYILPYLLGWHAYANSTMPGDASRMNSANPRSGVDFEWTR